MAALLQSEIKQQGERQHDCQANQDPQPVSYTHLDVYKRQVAEIADAVEEHDRVHLSTTLALRAAGTQAQRAERRGPNGGMSLRHGVGAV